MMNTSPASHHQAISTAEAFYQVFCALSRQDRLDVARYIFQNDEIRHDLELTEIPNDLTMQSFAERSAEMPVFESVQDLREELLAEITGHWALGNGQFTWESLMSAYAHPA